MLMLLLGFIMVAVGSIAGGTITPDLPEEPHIMEVNIEEFREINKELGLAKNTRNVELNSEGEVVFVKDKEFDEAYTVVKGGGDISSREYLRRREDVLEHESVVGTRSVIGAFGGFVLWAISLFTFDAIDTRMELQKERENNNEG